MKKKTKKAVRYFLSDRVGLSVGVQYGHYSVDSQLASKRGRLRYFYDHDRERRGRKCSDR